MSEALVEREWIESTGHEIWMGKGEEDHKKLCMSGVGATQSTTKLAYVCMYVCM